MSAVVTTIYGALFKINGPGYHEIHYVNADDISQVIETVSTYTLITKNSGRIEMNKSEFEAFLKNFVVETLS